jgi:methylisocitrate lyase
MSRRTDGASRLRSLVNRGQLVVAVGVHDALSALLVPRAGFEAAYLGSFAMHATFLGKPDRSLLSKTETVTIARNVTRAVDIPLIVDMEEGYGNALSVRDAVRDLEAAGVAAVHMDDEVIPGKCPFLPDLPRSSLVDVDEMCGKIRAAVEAREDGLMVIARCDVIATVPLEQYRRERLIEEVVARSNKYAEAGADAVFVMALNVDELRYFREAIKAPLVGVFAPLEPIPVREFALAGYQIVLGSVASLYMSTRGLLDGLRSLKESGDWNAVRDKIVDRQELLEILGLEKYGDLYRRYRI